jgi:uncharacterized protein (DUF433 family)
MEMNKVGVRHIGKLPLLPRDEQARDVHKWQFSFIPRSLLVNRPNSEQSAIMNEPPVPTLEPALAPEAPPLRMDDQQVIRVGPTRVTLDTLVAAFQHGDTPEEMARNYDALSLGQVYQAIGYYLAHQAEVDSYLKRRQALRGPAQKQVESKHNPNGIRRRLLARRKQAA